VGTVRTEEAILKNKEMKEEKYNVDQHPVHGILCNCSTCHSKRNKTQEIPVQAVHWSVT
jgi:hypothetical protein